MKKPVTLGTFILLGFIVLLLLPAISHSSVLTLAIANSTCVTMKKVGEAFTRKTNIKLNYLCQPSGLLAQGIKEGVLDVDYFLSANEKWMNDVKDAGFVSSKTIKTNWGNRLVLASLPLKEGEIKLETLADLNRPEVNQILIGDPKIAPYGMYAKEAMLNAGLWEKVQAKLNYNRRISISVRTLKKYGLSRRGIVAFLYHTNVHDSLLIHFDVPQYLYSPIKYYSAPIIQSKHKDEQARFLAFVNSEEVNDIFRSSGFVTTH